MIQFKSASLVRKLIYSIIPMFVGATAVTLNIYHTSTQKNENATRAIEMVNAVTAAELEMVKMSEALRGYLIDPSNEKEYAKKKAADAAYGEYSEKLAKLSEGFTDILELNRKMADYDAITLDKVENEVGELVQKHSPGASAFYTKTYVPAREEQTKNFQVLKKLVMDQSSLMLNQIEEKKASDGMKTILLLLLSVAVGCSVIFLIIFNTIQKMDKFALTLAESTGLLDTVSDKISQFSEEIAESTGHQASAIQQTTAAVDQTSAMITKNAENSRRSSDVSGQSQNSARKGNESVLEMMNSIESISSAYGDIIRQIEMSNSKVSEIVQVIAGIGDKTKVINDIVFQTKLLSFNASVEAARAGEHGKGFAVVAEEVGNLAQMSGNSAKEITELLESSTRHVENVVVQTRDLVSQLVASGKEKIQRGNLTAKLCSESLGEIVGNVSQVSALVGEISTASQEQAQGVGEITKAMASLDHAAQKNSTISRESMETVQEMRQTVSHIRDKMDELNAMIHGSAKNAA